VISACRVYVVLLGLGGDGVAEVSFFLPCPLLIQTFNLHIGADLQLPCQDTRERSAYQQEAVVQRNDPGRVVDPFEGLPFRSFAENLGARVAPVFKEIAEEDRKRRRLAKSSSADIKLPSVPHFLPFTRW
jgi:hypothetical protein